MIRHTVNFKTRHAKGSAAESKFLAAGAALAELPMVNNFITYRQVSEKNNFDFAFAMDFATQEDYDAYNQHPAHTEFVEKLWIPEVVEFLEVDYTPLEGSR